MGLLFLVSGVVKVIVTQQKDKMKSTIAVLACLLAVASALPKHNARIVGGSPIARGQAPYQVSLRTQMNQHFCGGAILTQNWILTSGHCVNGRQPADIIAVAGSVSLREGTGHQVSQIFLHPEFQFEGLKNDIAVVQIESRFVFNMIVQPASLGGEYINKDLNAMLTGWGQTSFPGSLSDELMGINMVTISNEECIAAHSSSSEEGAPEILETNICAVSGQETGACMGDSGSALVANRQIVGLMSWGVPCAKNLPDVFTRVSMYRDWIVETVVSNS